MAFDENVQERDCTVLFKFNGEAISSPLGPALANIFMCHFGEKWVVNNNARSSGWFRFVDDTLTLLDSENTATQFLRFLNNCYANSKFLVDVMPDYSCLD